jgi:hypothetical protein
MEKERRLALESYIGFMAFLNGWPVAYGGGWLFGHQCTIGVNIYPPYRGGDSARLFAEVMRLYARRFDIKLFTVKPYQFGYKNPEGLKSGAFWFYYKLGFRPAEPILEQLAASEWKKMRADKTYRCPLKILQRFTLSPLLWRMPGYRGGRVDVDNLSNRVTAMISQQYEGNRVKAVEDCKKQLLLAGGLRYIMPVDPLARQVLENWSLLYASLPGKFHWTAAQKKKFIALIGLKAAGEEIAFIKALQQHKAFWLALQ